MSHSQSQPDRKVTLKNVLNCRNLYASLRPSSRSNYIPALPYLSCAFSSSISSSLRGISIAILSQNFPGSSIDDILTYALCGNFRMYVSKVSIAISTNGQSLNEGQSRSSAKSVDNTDFLFRLSNFPCGSGVENISRHQRTQPIRVFGSTEEVCSVEIMVLCWAPTA